MTKNKKQFGPADNNGEYVVSFPVPAGISGILVHMQSVELLTCTVSDVVSYYWP